LPGSTPAGVDRFLLDCCPFPVDSTDALLASARTQTLRSEQPERSARLVWPEVPAVFRRALEHVPFTWCGPEPGRPM